VKLKRAALLRVQDSAEAEQKTSIATAPSNASGRSSWRTVDRKAKLHALLTEEKRKARGA